MTTFAYEPPLGSPIPHRMVCMEVWGGNRATHSSVVMSGLDAWVYSRPYGEGHEGGDIYYVSACATGRVTRLLVADVSGHGGSVAQTAVALRDLMRQYVNYLDQTRFIATLNHHLARDQPDSDFATALAATYFAPTNHLTLCNAGHPPPLLRHADTGHWSFLRDVESASDDPVNMPLGVVDHSRYEQFGLELAVGDLVLFYTDLLMELANTQGRQLGLVGLLQLVEGLDGTEPARFIPLLLESLRHWAGRELADDDVTLLLFRPNGQGKRTPLGEKMRAPWRLLRGFWNAWRQGRSIPWPEASVPNLGGGLFGPLNRTWRGPRR